MYEGVITDIQGIKVGHAHDLNAATGCTLILCEDGAVAGADVRGGAPGTREIDCLRAENGVDKVHAVVLAGGSSFGLDCAAGVMRYLQERGIGFETGFARIPIVSRTDDFFPNRTATRRSLSQAHRPLDYVISRGGLQKKSALDNGLPAWHPADEILRYV